MEWSIFLQKQLPLLPVNPPIISNQPRTLLIGNNPPILNPNPNFNPTLLTLRTRSLIAINCTECATAIDSALPTVIKGLNLDTLERGLGLAVCGVQVLGARVRVRIKSSGLASVRFGVRIIEIGKGRFGMCQILNPNPKPKPNPDALARRDRLAGSETVTWRDVTSSHLSSETSLLPGSTRRNGLDDPQQYQGSSPYLWLSLQPISTHRGASSHAVCIK
eukprot:1049816-Amorphochlora_amoeboformis.AAC.1